MPLGFLQDLHSSIGSMGDVLLLKEHSNPSDRYFFLICVVEIVSLSSVRVSHKDKNGGTKGINLHCSWPILKYQAVWVRSNNESDGKLLEH